MMDIFNRQAPMPWSQNPAPSLDMGAKQLAPISGMPAKPPNMDLDTYMAICGTGMRGPAGGVPGGGAPQGGPMQMPSAPFQSGMRAGSVGNQMGGLNNMYSNFVAPSPMPAPPPPMFGAPAGNSRAMMGPKPVGLF